MADPTKVIRFPKKQKLHLVWDSSSPENSATQPQAPAGPHRQPADVEGSAPHDPGGGTTNPDKPG